MTISIEERIEAFKRRELEFLLAQLGKDDRIFLERAYRVFPPEEIPEEELIYAIKFIERILARKE